MDMEPWRVSKRGWGRGYGSLAFFLLFKSRLSSSRHSLQLQEDAKFTTLTLSNWKGGGGDWAPFNISLGQEPHPEPDPLETRDLDKTTKKTVFGRKKCFVRRNMRLVRYCTVLTVTSESNIKHFLLDVGTVNCVRTVQQNENTVGTQKRNKKIDKNISL
jgi:hypothetical protein